MINYNTRASLYLWSNTHCRHHVMTVVFAVSITGGPWVNLQSGALLMQLIRRADKTNVSDNIVARATNFLHRKRPTNPPGGADDGIVVRRLRIWSLRKSQDAKVGVVRPTRLTAQTSLFSLSVTIPIHVSDNTLAQIRPFMPSRWQLNALILLCLLFLLLLFTVVQQLGRTIGLAEIILLGVNDIVRGVFKLVNMVVGIRWPWVFKRVYIRVWLGTLSFK